eukprot:43797-Prymnesium_polylepis.1
MAARAKYNLELRRLQDNFPDYAVRALAMAHASQHHTRPCPCGHGCLARWPWVVQTAAQGFCDCDMAFWERTCSRAGVAIGWAFANRVGAASASPAALRKSETGGCQNSGPLSS